MTETQQTLNPEKTGTEPTKTKKAAARVPAKTGWQPPAGVALVKAETFVGMNPNSQFHLALKDLGDDGVNLSASDLLRATLPSSKGKLFTISGPQGEEEVNEIEGILVHFGDVGFIWGTHGDITPGVPPVVISHDLVTGHVVGTPPKETEEQFAKMFEACTVESADDGLPKTIDWKGCPWTQFGSDPRGGPGKRADERKVMFILRPQDNFPLMVSAPSGSIKNVATWRRQIALAGLRSCQAQIKLHLETQKSADNIDFAQIVPELTGALDPAKSQSCRDIWQNTLRLCAGATDIATAATQDRIEEKTPPE